MFPLTEAEERAVRIIVRIVVVCSIVVIATLSAISLLAGCCSKQEDDWHPESSAWRKRWITNYEAKVEEQYRREVEEAGKE